MRVRGPAGKPEGKLALRAEARGTVKGRGEALFVDSEGGLNRTGRRSAGRIEGREADLVLVPGDQPEADGVVVEAPADGELGVSEKTGSPDRRQPRRHLQVAHDF